MTSHGEGKEALANLPMGWRSGNSCKTRSICGEESEAAKSSLGDVLEDLVYSIGESTLARGRRARTTPRRTCGSIPSVVNRRAAARASNPGVSA